MLTTSVPPLPIGFQAGDPPAFYQIETTASFTGVITVCLPYGDLPAGSVPRLLHYDSGQWQDATTSFTVSPNIVCGSVSSLSPFAAVFIHYVFAGFFKPVDSFPTYNSVKAGSAVPVKFSLGGDKGLGIFAPGYPRSVPISCDSTAPADATEPTVSSGGSSLSYDATTSQYTYVWKTDKAWATTCRQLVVRFVDLTEERANFFAK